jgi:hypothetical protein
MHAPVTALLTAGPVMRAVDMRSQVAVFHTRPVVAAVASTAAVVASAVADTAAVVASAAADTAVVVASAAADTAVVVDTGQI